jgi:hypothetical protein
MSSVLDDRRPRGRPKLAEPTSPVSTRLPQAHHDRLIKWAARGDVSVSKLVQTIVAREIERRTVKT